MRWVHRATRAAVLAYVAPRAIAVALALVQLDVIVDWSALAVGVRAAPGWAVGVVAAGCAAAVALDGRWVVRATLFGPSLALLRRQPIPAWAWGPAAVVVLAPVASPMVAVAAALHHAALGPAALWLALAVGPALAVAARRPAVAAAAVAGAAAVAASAHATGGHAAWALAAWALVVPALGAATAAWGVDRPGAPVVAAPWRPGTPFGAVLHRDLLTVWRVERSVVGAAVGAAVVPGVVAALMARSGDWAGPALTAGVATALAASGPSALAAVSAVARRLGRRLDPPEWPISAMARAAALATVGALPLVPGWAAAAVAAPGIGVGHLRLAAFVAAIGAGAAWWVARRPARPNPGTWGYWVGLCLGAALLPGGALWAAALAGLGWRLATTALERARGRP